MTKRGRRTSEHIVETRRTRLWLGLGGLAAVAALAAILLLQPSATLELDEARDPVLGERAAPVTVYYFADFQCPFCRAFELGGLQSLKADEIARGEVRLVFKDFSILGDDSTSAAEASQYVWERSPGAYWEWHRAIFEAQGAERSGWASPARLVALSSGVPGVDASGMAEALADDRYLAETRDDRAQGDAAGVRGTPTLVIGGQTVNANDAAGIDALLAEARR